MNASIEVVHPTEAQLEGRTARCGPECRTEPSRPTLAFFEYLGPGSTEAEHLCGACGKYDFVHQPTNPGTGRPGITDHPFTARGPREHDRYYCGCRGWD